MYRGSGRSRYGLPQRVRVDASFLVQHVLHLLVTSCSGGVGDTETALQARERVSPSLHLQKAKSAVLVTGQAGVSGAAKARPPNAPGRPLPAGPRVGPRATSARTSGRPQPSSRGCRTAAGRGMPTRPARAPAEADASAGCAGLGGAQSSVSLKDVALERYWSWLMRRAWGPPEALHPGV